MDIREMHYILEIAKTKNLTRAADNLFISQPALSKSLRKIEKELDTTLFYREDNEMRPTDTGKVVLEKAQSILKLSDELTDSVAATKNLKQGKCRLGFPTIVGVMYMSELVFQFQQAFPGISLCTVEDGGFALTKQVADGSLDAAIVMRPVYSESLNEIPIVRGQMVACVNRHHIWHARSYITIRDFKDMPFITFNPSFNIHTQIIERCKSENIKPNIQMMSGSAQFLYQYARLSNSVLVLSEPMIKMYCDGDPVKLLPFRPAFPWELCLIFKKNAFLSTATKALISFIQKYFFNYHN